MLIDIYYLPPKRYVAARQKQAIPESWAAAKFFKTIDPNPSDVKIGLGDADAIQAAIEKDGYADGDFRWLKLLGQAPHGVD